MDDERESGGRDEGHHTREQESIRRPSLSVDATLELLSSWERREILDFLRAAESNTATVDEVVHRLLTKSEARTGEQPPHDQTEVTTMHIHVPKLADAGLVEYDVRSQEMRYWGNERVEKWLETIQEKEERDAT